MADGLKVKAMDHVAIMVSDLERAYRFYHDLLGMEKQEYYEEKYIQGVSEVMGLSDVQMKIYIMSSPLTPGVTLHVTQLDHPRSPTGRPEIHHAPSTHICFTVDDIEGIYEALKARGAEFVSKPVHYPPEAGGWGICFLYDPDGNLLELVEVL